MIDDSSVSRDLLTYILETDPRLKVIGYAENGEEALNGLKYQTADVITMDINMPIIDGFETTRRIMQTKPIPIVIVSSSYNRDESEKSFLAIEAGALAIIQKPQGIYDHSLILELLEIIHTISGSKLITRRKGLSNSTSLLPKSREQNLHAYPISAIAIGASLGGPIAVQKILSSLPSNIPVPILLVQHISKGFTQGFADWLQKSSNLRIKIAEHREFAQPGCVYIAPDENYMTILEGNIIALESIPKDDPKPGIGKLFLSMAKAYGPRAIGVILTGMGKDGAAELLDMRQRGALTIAQDESSCVLFGMPKEAIQLGAAKLVLPLDEIAETLMKVIKHPV